MTDYKVGQTVEVKGGKKGIIRYIGPISAAEGEFIGLELSTPDGKNDGAAQGERLFTCPPNHGLFLKSNSPSIIKVLSAPRPLSNARAPAKPVSSRFSTAGRPTSTASSTTNTASKPASRPSSLVTSPKPSLANRVSSTASRKSSVSTARQAASSSSDNVRKSIGGVARAKDSSAEAYETKIRHLEKLLAEAKDHVKEFDRISGDRARFEGLVQKLQSKCQSFHIENSELKAQAKLDKQELQRLTKSEEEHEELLELATLDKEMAEEKADQAIAELEGLRSRLEEKELELEILQSEAELHLDDDSADAPQGASYQRLSRENERLREALRRLKEITDDKEHELQSQIKELESDAGQVPELHNEITELKTDVAQKDAKIQDLHEQIDAVQSSEELVVELSERNDRLLLQLHERDDTIKDLEDLKELNDELEAQHVEEAADLRFEIEARDIEIAQQASQIAQQEELISEQELLIGQFRDALSELQSKISEVESSEFVKQEQSQEITSRLHEVMEVNRKLQRSNLSSMSRQITSELSKMEAEVAREEMAIVKHYVDDSPEFFQNNSLQAYFCAKRIGFKSNLAATLINSPQLATTDQQDRFTTEIYRHSATQLLSQVRLKGTRFWNAVATSNIASFEAFSSVYLDMLPIEKTIDRLVESIELDDVKYRECCEDVERSERILDDMLGAYPLDLNQHPEDEIPFRISKLKSNYDLIKACAVTAKGCLEASNISEIDHALEQLNDIQSKATEHIIVAEKLIKVLDSYKSDSLYPNLPQDLEYIREMDEQVKVEARALFKLFTSLVEDISANASGEKPLTASDIEKLLSQAQDSYTSGRFFNPWSVVKELTDWYHYASELRNCVEFERPAEPWVLQARAVHAKRVDDAKFKAEYERELQQNLMLQRKVHESIETVQTKKLENETLQARLAQKEEKLKDLQATMNSMKEEHKDFDQVKARLEAELDRMKHDVQTHMSAEAEKVVTQDEDKPADEEEDAAWSPRQPKDTATTRAFDRENMWLRERKECDLLKNKICEAFTQVRCHRALKKMHQARAASSKLDDALLQSMGLKENIKKQAVPASEEHQSPESVKVMSPESVELQSPGSVELQSPESAKAKSPESAKAKSPESVKLKSSDLESFEWTDDLSMIAEDLDGEFDAEIAANEAFSMIDVSELMIKRNEEFSEIVIDFESLDPSYVGAF